MSLGDTFWVAATPNLPSEPQRVWFERDARQGLDGAALAERIWRRVASSRAATIRASRCARSGAQAASDLGSAFHARPALLKSAPTRRKGTPAEDLGRGDFRWCH